MNRNIYISSVINSASCPCRDKWLDVACLRLCISFQQVFSRGRRRVLWRIVLRAAARQALDSCRERWFPGRTGRHYFDAADNSAVIR